jgi:hypothetical protein
MNFHPQARPRHLVLVLGDQLNQDSAAIKTRCGPDTTRAAPQRRFVKTPSFITLDCRRR